VWAETSLDEDSLYLAFLFVSGAQPGTWLDRTNVTFNTYPGFDPLSEVGVEMDGAFISLAGWAAGSGGRALLNATSMSLFILPSWIDSINTALENYTAPVRVGEGSPIPPVILENAVAVLTAARTLVPSAECARAYQGDNVTDIPDLEEEPLEVEMPGAEVTTPATPSAAVGASATPSGPPIRGSSGSSRTSVVLAFVTAAVSATVAAFATEH
jgi:hypothetical protein